MILLTSPVEMDATEVFENIENLKNVNPGVIETYLKGLVPDIIAFLIQVAVAAVVYLIGVQLIKLVRRALNWVTTSLVSVAGAT